MPHDRQCRRRTAVLECDANDRTEPILIYTSRGSVFGIREASCRTLPIRVCQKFCGAPGDRRGVIGAGPLRRRSSEPHRPRVMRSVPRGVRRYVDRRACRPAIEPRNFLTSGRRRVRHRKCPVGLVWSKNLACTYAPCAGTGRSPARPLARKGWSTSERRGVITDDERAGEVRRYHSNCEAAEQIRAIGCGVGGAKGNLREPHTHRTRSRGGVSLGLERVRERARQGKKERFTALLHHVTVDLVRTGGVG